MKEMTKKTAVVVMAGIIAAGMLTGCGEKKLDGSKTVATVDGTEIPLGVVNLSVRDGQMQTSLPPYTISVEGIVLEETAVPSDFSKPKFAFLKFLTIVFPFTEKTI